MRHPHVHPPAAVRLAGGVLTLAVLATLSGCGTNSSDDDGGAPGPGPTPQPGAPVVYTALGASDTAGVGSSAPCAPFTSCPEGRGYVQIVARELGRDAASMTVSNLGVPGSVLSPTIQEIGNQYGRGIPGNLLDQQMRFVPRNSTVVSVFVGGNDVNAIATAVDRGAAGGDPAGYIDTQVRRFAADYAALLRGIRDRSPSARIVALNLPNFAALPYAAGRTSVQRGYMQRLSVGFSREGANALTGLGVAVVDLMCDARSYQRTNYSSDGFHPSDAGYAFMAAELLQAIRNAGYPPPQGDCSFMRLL